MNPCTLLGPAGKGGTAGLLPVTDQEYLGRCCAECYKGGGMLPWYGDEVRQKESLTWGFCQRQGGRGQLAGGEGTGVDRVGENTVGGCSQATAFRLCRTKEITPTGLGICAAVHSQHWGRLRPGGTGAAGSLHSRPLTGPGRGNTRERTCPHTHETGRPSPPLTDKKMAPENWMASCVITGHLVVGLRG